MSNTRKPTNPPEAVEAETDGVEDFDAFWSSQTRKRKTVRIMGEDIELPPSVPLQYEFEAKRAATSESDEDVRRLVAILFGGDRTEDWAAKGMDLEQFQVLLYWAPQVIEGSAMTLAEAAARVRAASEPVDPTKRQKRRKH